MLGFRFPANFNQPYRAERLREFWQRWHISLSSWLRDYLYMPLGGNRHGRLKTYRNLMLTMLLGGIWHGAAWKFVDWGALHGGGLAIERMLEPWLGRHAARARRRGSSRSLVVFHFVCLAWIFFRAEDFDDGAGCYIAGLGGRLERRVAAGRALDGGADRARHGRPITPRPTCSSAPPRRSAGCRSGVMGAAAGIVVAASTRSAPRGSRRSFISGSE